MGCFRGLGWTWGTINWLTEDDMTRMKKDRLRKLVQWGYVSQVEANRMYRDYLRLFKRVAK